MRQRSREVIRECSRKVIQWASSGGGVSLSKEEIGSEEKDDKSGREQSKGGFGEAECEVGEEGFYEGKSGERERRTSFQSWSGGARSWMEG